MCSQGSILFFLETVIFLIDQIGRGNDYHSIFIFRTAISL